MTAAPSLVTPLDVTKIRADFPILATQMHGKPLVYLDNAATGQKPRAVIDTISRYYETTNANVHRGVYQLSEQATRECEEARIVVKQWLNARDAREIIFTRGCTDGINLVASSYGQKFIREGDEIIITAMEHHSNIVPWQLLCERSGVVLRVVPINDDGELLVDEYEKLLCERTKFVSLVHVSNSLGTINPVKRLIELAHGMGAKVLLDGAQATPHMAVDVQDLDADFYTLSGHKVFGPTGIGVLYGKEELLDAMPPYQGGGDMISHVSFEKTLYNALPYKFEAGTPHMAGIIGLGAAIQYIQGVGIDAIGAHEADLLAYATERVQDINGFRIIGTAREKASVLSFVVDGAHSTDIGQLLDTRGVAVRTGHHCTQPLMDRFGVPGTARASFAFYNTREEVDKFVSATQSVLKMLR